MRISVVIPCHNYGKFLPRAVESIDRQNYPRELTEVIVVDDGSTDSTKAIVDSIYLPIRYIY